MHSKSKIVWLTSSSVLVSALVVFVGWRVVVWSRMGWAGVVFTSANDVDTVLDGSPAAAAGVRRGDHLLYLNGVVSNETELLSGLARRARVGETVTYRLKRNSQQLSVPIQLVSLFRNTEFVVNLASTTIVSLAFMGIGVFVYAKKPEDRRAGVFYMLCVAASAYNLGGFAYYIDYENVQGLIPFRSLIPLATRMRMSVSLILLGCVSSLFLVLLFHLALVFPRERPVVKRSPHALRWIYGLWALRLVVLLEPLDVNGLVGKAPPILRLALVIGALGLGIAALASCQKAIRSSGWKRGLFSRPITILLALTLFVFSVGTSLLLPEAWLPVSRAWVPRRPLSFWLTLPAAISSLFIFFFCPMATCVALHRSYRESGVEQKRQIRWPLWGIAAAILGGVFLPGLLIIGIYGIYILTGLIKTRSQVVSMVPLARACFSLLIPISFGFAILKHRLMDIDRIIKKTIIYTLLSAILVALYFSLVGGLGVLLVRLTRVQSGVITVFSTLAIAAVFVPLRNRVQGFVDRRFFRQKYDYPSALRALGRNISAAQDPQALVQFVAEQLQQALPNRAVVIFIRTPREQAFSATAKIGLPDEAVSRLKFDADSPLFRALDAPLALAHLEMPEQERIKLRTAKSTLLVPLKLKGTLLGFISLGSKLSEQDYDANDKEFLAAVADQVAMGIDNLWLRMSEQEVEEARKIQQGLLPKEIPQFPSFEIAGAWQPARVVSGDYFDVIRLSGSKFALCIGDVVGKGMPAALLMSNLQAAVKAFASEWMPPQELCDRVNQVITSNIAPGKFITFFYALVDTERKTLAYANAGHNPPALVRRDGSTARFTEGGTVLGVFADSQYQQQEEKLAPGDRIVLFTDGLTEATDSDGEQLGEERLIGLVASSRELRSEALQQRVLEAVREFCHGNFDDDATLVVVSVE